MDDHHDHEPAGSLRGWIIILAICAVIVAWGMVNFWFIPDTPRQWDFGTLPDAPGESVYSVDRPRESGDAPRQITPLPEAKPKKKKKQASGDTK